MDGRGFDSTGNRAVLPRLLAPPEVLAFTSFISLNQTVTYTMNLFERDCDDGDVLCRGIWIGTGILIAAGVVWAVAALCPPCAAALLTAEEIGITALAASAYVALLLEGIQTQHAWRDVVVRKSSPVLLDIHRLATVELHEPAGRSDTGAAAKV